MATVPALRIDRLALVCPVIAKTISKGYFFKLRQRASAACNSDVFATAAA